MRRFLFNLFLALLWCMLTGSGDPWNFVAGLAVGAVVVSVQSNVTGQGPYLGRGLKLLRFTWYFLQVLVKANLQIAWDIITPGFSHSPRLLRYPVGHLNDVHTTALANTITLTPGTLAVDVSPDGEWLYLHCMYAEDPVTQLAEIDKLADRLKEGIFS